MGRKQKRRIEELSIKLSSAQARVIGAQKNELTAASLGGARYWFHRKHGCDAEVLVVGEELETRAGVLVKELVFERAATNRPVCALSSWVRDDIPPDVWWVQGSEGTPTA